MSTITAAIAQSVDPVCDMQVDAASAAARLTHAGQDYLFCSSQCLEKFRADPKRYALARPGLALRATMPAVAHGMPLQTALRQGQQGQAKDPICGMLVDKATALKTERGGRSYYFCSAGCQRTFESPEQELKSMKTRVAIALTGVLALAMMRAGAFIGLATGATIQIGRAHV